MKIQNSIIIQLLFSFLLLQSCASKTEKKEEDNSLISIKMDSEEGSASISINKDNFEALENLDEDNGAALEVVDFQELKKLLPEKVMGAKRTNIEGQKSDLSGFMISTVRASYEEDNTRINISITDAQGSTITLAGMAMVWLNTEFERESEDGFERTTKIDGHKAFEKYNRNSREGQLSVLVNKRFLVNMEGSGIEEKDLHKILDNIGLRQLSRLK